MPVDNYNPVIPYAVGDATKIEYFDWFAVNVDSIYDSLRGVHELFLPASALRPHPSGGCGPLEDLLLSSGRYVAGYPFDPTSIESASFGIALPQSWNRGTVTFQPLLLNTAGGSGAVVTQVAAVSAGDDETLDAAVGTFVTSTDTVLAAKRLMLGPESAAITIAGTPAAGDFQRFVFQRDPTAGGDTYASDIYLLGVKLRLTTTWPTDDV